MSSRSVTKKNLRLILAAKTGGLSAELNSTKFMPMPGDHAIEVLECAGLWLGPRPTLEETEEFRQIIPYVLLQYGDGFVRYARTPAGGEARLHGRISVGLGGHIDLPDIQTTGEAINLARTLDSAAEREVLEELGEVKVSSKEWIGLLVENDSAVGRVHIGVIGLWRLESMPVASAEDAIGDVSWCSLPELRADFDRLESWSAMLLPWMSGLGAK